MSANLILHWHLDSLTPDNKVVDTTDNHLNADAEGDPQTVPDEKFGSCLLFDGQKDTLTLPDSPLLRLKPYTVEVWINPNPPGQGWSGIIGKPGRNYCMFLNSSGYIHHRFATPTNSNDGFNTPNGSITWDAWQHVAMTNDGRTARTYINGTLAAEYTVAGDLVVHQRPLIVGRNLDDAKNLYFGGRLAHIRLYDAPLSPLEIQRDMAQDEAALAAFVRTHPLDFNLFNEDQHHVLYIDDDPAGQTMTLDLTNTARQDVILKNLGEQVSDKVCHFELRFRAETVAQTPVPQLATDGWVMSRKADNTSFYLLHKGEFKLPAGQSTDLTLRGMNADGRGGTRGSRVEMLYQRVVYAGEVAELNGSRLQYIDVVNHRGLREIPLHVGFVGGDSVLSDGSTPSPLRLRIANTSRDAKLKLNAKTTTTPASAIVVSFDMQAANETREWALIGAANADAATLRVTEMRGASGKWADPVKRNLGQSIEWTLTPSENVELGPDGSILLALDKVIALASLGHANIYINYQDIPGYQNGVFVVSVEKTPLLFWQQNVTDKPMVGIGRQPSYALDVNGNIAQRGFDFALGVGDNSRGDTGYSRALVKDGGSRLTINYASDFKGGVTINGPQISLIGSVGVGTASAEAKLQIIHQNQDPNGNALIIGPTTQANLRLGYNTEYSWIQSHGAKPLAINAIGNNVGIGTTTPGYRLHVAGTAYTDELLVGASYSFARMLAGHTRLGSHGGGVKKISINFPQAFRRKPYVVVTTRNEGYYNDTFACTVRLIDTTRFEVNIMRMDINNGGWDQNPRLDWIAWETTRDSDA